MDTTEQIIEKLDHVLRAAGVASERHEIGVRCKFNLPNGRTQMVDIEPVTAIPSGLQIIAFFSRCERLTSRFFGNISGTQALRILKFNSTIPIGYFCIKEIEGQRFLCVRSTQILETMDKEELKMHLNAVAQLADSWEEKLGQDEF